MTCHDGWDLGEPNGECPDCKESTLDGKAVTGCNWSIEECPTCGSAPCIGSC